MRLNELLGNLSLAADLAVGVGEEGGLRTALAAVGIGRALGVTEARLADAYYAALLRYLGCTGFAHETARAGGGDDIALLQAFEDLPPGAPIAVVRRAVTRLGRGGGAVHRAATLARFLGDPRAGEKLAAAHCAQATQLASSMGMPAGVRGALNEVYERFDGRGAPQGLRGEAISLPARIVHVANVAEVHARLHGPEGAGAAIRRRRGRHLDPTVCDAFLRVEHELVAALRAPSAWEAFVAAEPRPHVVMADERLGTVALAFARFVDLKSPFTLGHSTGVAELAVAAATAAGWPARDREELRIAALLHDLGRASVPNGIWDKPGPLNAREWERVRQHPYHTQRILAATPILRPFSALAAAHHERLDGSGYHRGLAGAGLTPAARLLAACDAYRAMREPRAWRPARGEDEVARALGEAARAGQLDRDAVALVLAAAGQTSAAARVPRPAGLTEREVEVLTLLARGRSNKEIASALGISPKTVQHHVAHVYEKAGLSSRAAAALFATMHGLLDRPAAHRPSGP